MSARFHSFDHLQRMPMIGRPDEYDVELVLSKHLSIIRISHGLPARLLPLAGHERGVGRAFSCPRRKGQ